MTLFKLVCVALVVGSGVGLVSIFSPMRFGETEWEFAALGEAAITTAPLAIGLTGLAIAWMSQGLLYGFMSVGVGSIFVGVGMVVGAALAALNLPLVWAASSGSGVGELKLVGVKTVVLLLLYGGWFLFLGWRTVVGGSRHQRF